ILDLIHGRGAGLVVEIKEPGTEAVIVSGIMDLMPDRLILVSFNLESVAMAKRLLPGVQAGLIYSKETVIDPVGLARQVQADIILPRWDRVSREVVEQAHKAGLLVFPWTLNTQEDVEEAAR